MSEKHDDFAEFEHLLDLLIRNGELLVQLHKQDLFDGTKASLESRQDLLIEALFIHHQKMEELGILSTVSPEKSAVIEEKLALLRKGHQRLYLSCATKKKKKKPIKKAKVHPRRKKLF